ncbi:MAG TPA: PHB depolymerase family esterase [Burkholderiaceae bacterium]|jgi:poly(hydroxyalkanoate) depolymerase family esterase
MARRSPWAASVQRTLKALRRSATRAVVAATKQALRASRPTPAARRATKRPATAPRPATPRAKPQAARWTQGVALTPTGARSYRVFAPPSAGRGAPLFVLLHGCMQDAQAIAHSTRIATLAAREGFVVLCPEQDRLANVHGCWNWYQQRSGRARNEAAILLAAIDQVCALQDADARRVVIAGLSAGGSMAALLGLQYPERFAAVAMHSGVAPAAAPSAATALRAMQGRGRPKALPTTQALPPLLVIQGRLDGVVAARNGEQAARWWAAAGGAKAAKARVVQRGRRLAASITDYRAGARLAVTWCEIAGLGHAWSGGAAGQAYSDPNGPDATAMIWAFAVQRMRQASDSTERASNT